MLVSVRTPADLFAVSLASTNTIVASKSISGLFERISSLVSLSNSPSTMVLRISVSANVTSSVQVIDSLQVQMQVQMQVLVQLNDSLHTPAYPQSLAT